jgi:hypothetical protein
MKTPAQISKLIKGEIATAQNQKDDYGAPKQTTVRKIRLLKELLMYVEKVKTPSFVQNQIDEIESKLENIKGGYSAWAQWQTCERMKINMIEYQKYMGVPKLKTQLSNLKFLLKD